ncbi:MAG: hypothetical protein KatS3mg026_1793 [Bacteroidia bacterium]|nr:MAG: hypothetical protein KatS3mg026_1793 [Bacteroidia bacterium]
MRYLAIALLGLAWAQSPLYPPNPYQVAFEAAYDRHPTLPRGVLEAWAYTQSRFMPLVPQDPSCVGLPQGWGLFGWIADGKGFFPRKPTPCSQAFWPT